MVINYLDLCLEAENQYWRNPTRRWFGLCIPSCRSPGGIYGSWQLWTIDLTQLFCWKWVKNKCILFHFVTETTQNQKSTFWRGFRPGSSSIPIVKCCMKTQTSRFSPQCIIATFVANVALPHSVTRGTVRKRAWCSKANMESILHSL